MFCIKKEFEVDFAHRLTFHQWKCYNVHWHRYKIIIELKWMVDKNWLLQDFWDLKWIKNWLDDNRDHAYVYFNKDEVWNYLTEKWFRTFDLWDLEPTAENMAMYLYNLFNSTDPMISSVTVYETPTASAIYPIKKDN